MKLSSLALCLLIAAPAAQAVDFTTLEGKVLLAYQGWFNCPGDGATNRSWRSWATDTPSAKTLTADMYPDLSEFNPSDLCPVPGLTIRGRQAFLYSAMNSNVVDRHFLWMKDYGLDGVLIQRFLTQIPARRSGGDVVLKNILQAARHHGRAIAIEYDVTGASPKNFFEAMRADWEHLVTQLKVTSHPCYLHHRGKPVLSVWGMGLAESRHAPRDPATALRAVNWFKTDAPPEQRVTYMGGVPSRWHTLSKDSMKESGWREGYARMDVLQPWTVDPPPPDFDLACSELPPLPWRFLYSPVITVRTSFPDERHCIAVSTGTPWTDQMIADIQGLQERAGEFAMGASPIPPNIEDFITGWQEAFVVGEGLEMRPIYDEDAFNLALEKWQDQKQAGMDLQEILNGLNRDYDSGAINAGQYATYMDILNDKFETGVTDIELWELKVQGAAQTIADGLLEVSNSGEVATSGIKRFGVALGVSIVDFREKALKAFNDVAGGISGSGEKIREWFLQQQAAIKNWRLEFADGVNFVSQAWGTLAQDANLTAGEIVAGLDEAVQATRDLRTNMTEVIEKGLSEEALEQIYTLPADQMATIFAGLSTATGKQIDQINTKVARGGDIAASVATTAADAINLTMERLTGAVELMVASILNIDPSEVSAMVDDIVNRANESTARLKNRTVDIGFNVDESSLIGGLMQGTGTSTSQAKTPEIPLPDLGKVTTDFQAVGTAATQGIEQGMTTGAAGVRAAADALGTEMVDATAQSIGAASPATEFIAIGNSVIEGLVLGISQKSHLLTLQMRGIGANMAQGMREGLLQGLL